MEIVHGSIPWSGTNSQKEKSMHRSWEKMITKFVAIDVYTFCGVPKHWFELCAGIDGRMIGDHAGISFRLSLIFAKIEIDIYDIRHEEDSDEPCQG